LWAKLGVKSAGAPQHIEVSYDSEDMADHVPRPELDAKLDAIRQEIRADSAALRGDMANWRGELMLAVQGLTAANTALADKVDGTSERVSALKWWILGAVVTVLGIVWGSVVSVQQMTTATFQGGSQYAKDQAQVLSEIKQIQQELAKQKESKNDERSATAKAPPAEPTAKQ
jgi:hypothetical protein